jgi:hypothetical protein
MRDGYKVVGVKFEWFNANTIEVQFKDILIFRKIREWDTKMHKYSWPKRL